MKYEAYVSRLCEYLRTTYFAGEWTMYLNHVKQEELGDEDTVADINIDSTYLNFRLRFGPKLREWYTEKRYWRIAETLCHEFAHLLTEPFYTELWRKTAPDSRDKLEELRERQTQRTSNAIMALIPHDVYVPKAKPQPATA